MSPCSVSSIIDKLPPSWKDFKHTLKHGKDDLSLVQLGSHLRIEESLRCRKVIMARVKKLVDPLLTWTEGRWGHSKDCRSGKKNNANAGGSEKGLMDQSQNQGQNLVDAIAWWIDFGATTHVCKDRCWFKTFEPVEDGSVLYMGDEHFAPIHGKGRAVVRLPEPKRKTLGEKGIDCIFVGYAEHSKAYRFYVIEPNDSVSINSIIESRDAIFDENRFSSIPRPKDIIPNVQEYQLMISDVPNEILEPRRGKRAKKAKSYGSDFQLYLVEGSRDQVGSQYSYCYSIEEDPRTYNEAMQSRDAAFWKEAIDDEIGSIMENNTWVLSDLPPGCKPLGCKWIFKRKMKVDGTIDKFKARLVIQGFRQKEGIDYFDTYAPVARITTIRLLLALAAIHNLVIHQMDVKTAFLNGDLDEEVYMKQPEGFVMPGNEHKVCKLVKSLYGLKQAPKQWHQKFDEVVLSSGFHLNQSDKCVYSKFDNSGKGVIICLYVDDMLIFGTDQNQVYKTKKFLSSRFSMKEYGDRTLSRFTSNPSRQHWKAITRVFKYLRGTKDYGLSYVGYPSVLEGYSDASARSKGTTYVRSHIRVLSRAIGVSSRVCKGKGAIAFWAGPKIYKTEVELQQNDLIKTLRTDRGGEYYDPVFFQSVGIIHETTAPYTPQQNGVAERKNRALKEMVNSIFSLYLVEGSRDQVGSQYSYCYSIEEDPRTYDEAMQSRDAAFWKEAIDDEIGSIMKNNTWVLSDLPLVANFSANGLFKRRWKVDGTKKKIRPSSKLDCTPMDPVEKLKPNTGKPVDQLEYSRAIGCLMYAMTSTRLNIAYVVGKLRYPSVLEGYSDASWINHVEDSSSTSGWVFLLGGGAISWASKKQTCITSSTMESEFVALAAAGKEAEWLRNLIHEIPIWPKPIAPISIRCDSGFHDS
ncbi:zinc finger, CCHC-type containing protein [Tanacetum coccineum]